VHDLEIPGAVCQELAPQLRPFPHQAEGKFFSRIWRILTAGGGQVGWVANDEIDHWYSDVMRGIKHHARIGDSRGSRGDVDARQIEHAALAGEGVLHVDNKQHGTLDLDLDW